MTPNFWPTTLVDWAQIVSAVGTMGAVVVALFLANRKPVPQLRGGAHLVLMVQRGVSYTPELFDIRVTNIGTEGAVITSIGWCYMGWFRPRKHQYYQDVPRDVTLPNPTLPVRIQYGQTISFHLPLSGPARWTTSAEERGFFPDYVKKRSDLNRVRAVVATTIGPPLRIRPDSGVLDRIWEARQVFMREAPAAPEAEAG